MMKVPSTILLLLAISISLVLAQSASHEERYPINAKIVLSYRSNSSLFATTNPLITKKVFSKIVVSLIGQNYHQETLLQQDGSFSFNNVLPGPYQLEVLSPDFQFVPLRVDLSKKDSGKVKMKYIDQTTPLPHPLIIRPDYPTNYFQQPTSMLSVYYSMLSSPIILLMFGVGGMMYCLQMIDPEAMQELQREASGQQGPEKLPHHYLPELIAKPRKAQHITSPKISNAPGKASHVITAEVEESSSSDEE